MSNVEPDTPLFCSRCGVELTPGVRNFYLVRIEAMADPSSPIISNEDLHRDHRAEIAKLIDQMRHHSERELAEQVHRRMVLHLCGPCYRQWIENPVS